MRSYVHCSTFGYKATTVWTYLIGRWAHGALGSELQTALIVRVVHGSGRQLRVRVVLLLHRSIRQTSAEALAERTSANMLLLPSNTTQHLLLMGLYYVILAEDFSMTQSGQCPGSRVREFYISSSICFTTEPQILYVNVPHSKPNNVQVQIYNLHFHFRTFSINQYSH